MEVRVRDVIINVDRVVTEQDKAFLEHQANIIIGYFLSNERLKKVAYIMMADAGVTLAKLALMEEMRGEENGKGG